MNCGQCPAVAGIFCPGHLCHLAGSEHGDRIIVERAKLPPPRDAKVKVATVAPSRVPDPRLARIGACPSRGSELPMSQQPSGCCGGLVLTECKAGKGKVSGRVTTADCLECVEQFANS